MANKGNLKGARAEEIIRNMFRNEGYFVVRAVPYIFQGRDVTDIDLLLFGKAGFFRERINVDIKNKRTPQAIERFFWALGVMQVLKLDRCIVVTTEVNSSVVEFGRRSNISVIDGNYLFTSNFQEGDTIARLTEEEFFKAIKPVGAEELGKDLIRRYSSAKTRLLVQMSYDGCNLHLMNIGRCFDDIISFPGANASIIRVLYALLSHLLITIDYLTTKSEFSDKKSKELAIDDGLRYGTAGRYRIDEFSKILGACKNADLPQYNEVISRIVTTLKSGSDSLRVDMIAEYISKLLCSDDLFDLAFLFETQAFNLILTPIKELPNELKSFIFMLSDFYGIERSKIL